MSAATEWQDIADNVRGELKAESARRLALTAAGHPPPTSYSVGGRNVSWNEYMSTMMQMAKDAQDMANSMGGDDGICDEFVRMY